jgi:deazaflavin-dependent oxidoreductase (nitroreductase family)
VGLPHVAPEPPRGANRLVMRLLSGRLSCAFERSLPFRLIVWRLVPRAMAVAGGHLPLPGFAAGLLVTRDARNGRRHRRAVVYFNDGEDVIVVPSKGGMASNPHWLENALTDPEVSFGGEPFRAELVAEEAERAGLQALGDAYYPPYVSYRAHAAQHGRRIPLLRLVPRDPDPAVEDAARVGPFARLVLVSSQLANERGIYMGRRSTRFHVALYRRSGGRLGGHLPGFPAARIALVDHIGRKTGRRRTAPLICVASGDTVVVSASKAGQPTNPDWFHNLMARPETTVQIGRELREVRARVSSGEERERLWSQLQAVYPGFDFYRRNAGEREIPIVVLEARQA